MFYLVFNYFGLFSIIYFHSSTATGLAIFLLTTSFVLFLIFAHTTHIKKHSSRNNFIPDFQIGEQIRDEIIPNAVFFYMGSMGEDEEEDEACGEKEDCKTGCC